MYLNFLFEENGEFFKLLTILHENGNVFASNNMEKANDIINLEELCLVVLFEKFRRSVFHCGHEP